MKHIKYFKESVEVNHDIDVIIKHYFETALWTQEDTDEDDENAGGEGVDKISEKTIYDFSDDSRKQSKKEIEWFLDNCDGILDDTTDDMIGHDIWLTRNGHGAGFWDRGYDDVDEAVLVALSEELGDVDLYVGDDNKVYLESSADFENFDLEKFKKEYELKKSSKKYNL